MKPFFLLIATFISGLCFAQSTFEKTYDHVLTEWGRDIAEIPGGNFICLSSLNSGYSDVHLSAINQQGDTLWNRYYLQSGLSEIEPLFLLSAPSNGLYVIGDSVYCPNIVCYNNLHITRTDASGNVLWGRSYPLGINTYCQYAQLVAGGGLLMTGYGNSGTTVVRLDDNGDTLWTRRFDGLTHLSASAGTADGGFILTGRGKTGFRHLLLYRLNAAGDTLWTKSYGTDTTHYRGKRIVVDNDGGFLIMGDTTGSLTNADMFLLKTDSVGNRMWSTTYGGPNLETGVGLEQTTDMGLVLVANTQSYGAGESDIYMVRTDSMGVVLWTRTFGGTLNDHANTLKGTTDGGFIIVGSKQQSATTSDVYVIKTDDSGKVILNAASEVSSPLSVQVFPNPAASVLYLHLKGIRSSKIFLRVNDPQGRMVRSVEISSLSVSGLNYSLDVSGIVPGYYYLSLIAEGFVRTYPFLISRR